MPSCRCRRRLGDSGDSRGFALPATAGGRRPLLRRSSRSRGRSGAVAQRGRRVDRLTADEASMWGREVAAAAVRGRGVAAGEAA